MAFWYNEAKGDSKFSSLYRTDWNECNATLVFLELGIKESEDFYHLFMFAESVNDTIKVGASKDWKFTAELTSLKIARKDYIKTDFKTKKPINVTQHRVEKLFCKLIAEYDLTKIYAGSLLLQDGSMLDMILDGVDAGGNAITPEIIKMMSTPFMTLSVVENPEKIKLDELEVFTGNKGGWKGSGTSGQSEIDKLNDRLNFVLAQLRFTSPLSTLDSLTDVAQLLESSTSPNSLTISVWEMCLQLMK